MRLLCLLAASLAGLAAGASQAAGPPPSLPVVQESTSPLRLIPAQANLLLEIPDPGRLVKIVRNLQFLKQLQALPAVREQLDSTQARRGVQLLAYVEKTLGQPWPKLIDRLAGGGAALGVQFGPGNGRLVLVVQGKDEVLMQKFLDLAVAVVKDELARQESKDTVAPGDYHGIPGFQIGKDLFVARVGAALVLSNHKDALTRALDLHRARENGFQTSLVWHTQVLDANKLLPPAPLVRFWMSLAPFQASKEGKELYKTPRDNAALTIALGHYLDVFGRAPYFCAGLCEKSDGFLLTLRLPRGREGMDVERDLHLPISDKDGCLPLLAPKGVLYSASFYLDIARFWTDRARVFPADQVRGLEMFDQTSGRFLGGVKLSMLLQSAGQRHRIVVVHQPNKGYQRKPKQPFPAFAFVTEMKQAKFGRYVDTLLAAAGLLATTQINLTMVEETRNGCDIVGYRFDEKTELKGDVDDVRFNFSPCYARLENQFVFCSTVELCRELVDLLTAKATPGPTHQQGVASSSRDRVYAAGFARLLNSFQDQLIAQTILDQAVPPGEAKEQVQAFIKLVQHLGTLTSSIHFGKDEFHYDVRLRSGK